MKNPNKKKFEKILSDIKTLKIQGARNIAKAALYAYSIYPSRESKEKLIHARPTEPMLFNILDGIESRSYKKILAHFDNAQEAINNFVLKTIRNNDVIFTHCHSTNVINALIYSKKKGKKFQVYNTETRPMFQGRKTANELKKAGIKVTMFVDSALDVAIGRENKKDDIYSTKIFLGSDALLKKGIVNKIGSGVIAKIAKLDGVPLYIVADSWKYTPKKLRLEQRKLDEIWNNAPKEIRIKNPAFEFVPKKYITKIISELGILSYDKFVGEARKNNNRS